MKKLLDRLLGKEKGTPLPVGSAATDSSAGGDAPAGPAFPPHNMLEQLLIAAADDPSRRTAFEEAVMKAELYVGIPDPPSETGERDLAAGDQVQLFNVTAPDGASVPAVFTSEARIAEIFGEGVGFMRMNGEILLEMVAQDGAFLNPGLAYGVHWTPADLACLLGRPVRRVIEEDTRVMLGTPIDRPEALIASIDGAFAGVSGIEEAWLALAEWPTGDRGWYLDVRSALPMDEVSALLTEVYERKDPGGLPLDLIVNPPGGGAGNGIRIKPAETH